MVSLSSSSLSNNHKLYFSRSELTKILNCYSAGVSKGDWKDYSLNFKSNEAIFYFYKHSLASPDYILIKFRERRKKKNLYKLCDNKKNNKFENIDLLIAHIKRLQLSLI